jgi:acetoin utilization protein AcuC
VIKLEADSLILFIRKIEYNDRDQPKLLPQKVPMLEISPDMTEPQRPLKSSEADTRADTASSVFVGGEIFFNEVFGQHHPLSIPRHSGVVDLCNILGWLEDSNYKNCHAASEKQLERFHDADYIEVFKQTAELGKATIEIRQRYGIGTMENPIFSGMYARAASTVGGSILAANLALAGHVAFHPAGGTHHGRPDRASGFCYFNDPVFAIMTLLDSGLERVFYADLDAHHGDGVQDAFALDHRVFTLSVHEQNRWPYTGPVTDRAEGNARNLPVPAKFNDSELDWLVSNALLPLIDAFKPQALVLTCGADALKGDPLSGLEISNTGLWKAVELLVSACPRAVVLGGGGYNPWTVVRCWSGLWGRLSGQKLPPVMPTGAQALLRGFECDLLDEEDIDPDWVTTLADAPNTGTVREQVKRVSEQVMT